MTMPRPQRGGRATAIAVGVPLVVSVIASVTWVIAHAERASLAISGAALAIAIGSLGVALVLWAHHLLDLTPMVEQRHRHDDGRDDRAATAAELDVDDTLERRPFLRRMLMLATGAVGLSTLVPLCSLGPKPSHRSPWRAGRRLVGTDGRPITVAGTPVGGLVTAFPEGSVDDVDGPVVVIRVPRDRVPTDRSSWSPDGLLAFSKICTHAGCPVGLYQAESHTLLCPCHQSEFDVLSGARPISGPAATSLPQLPLLITPDGQIVATGRLSGPVGPASWYDK
jgi:ubiquinol-cytochrome c reductase iron-sulfur subunit